MRSRDPRIWMWAEACDLLEQAERLHRQFFVPARSVAKGPSWEPPVDVLETEHELAIQAALPGVAADQVQVVIDGGTLIITGLRPMPGQSRSTMIRRLEIPYGRFERRIALPAHLPQGGLELVDKALVDGCLILLFAKRQAA